MTILLVSFIVYGLEATHTSQYKTADECSAAREQLYRRAAYAPGIDILTAACSSGTPRNNQGELRKESHCFFGICCMR